MKRPSSLTLRLTLLFGLAAVIVLTGFGWFIERSIEHHFSSEDLAELHVVANAVSRALSIHGAANHSTDLAQRFEDILVGHHGAILHVTDNNGRTLYTSPSGPDLSKSMSTHSKHESFNRWSQGEHTYRVLSKRLYEGVSAGGYYTILVAVAIDYHLRFLDGFRRTLWITIAAGVIIMGLMGWIAVRQGHMPLRKIIAHIHQTSASELNTRLTPESVPRELSDLAVSFNDMLERMEAAFRRLSNFSDDIAHELRTPITNLLTQTQVALSQSRSVDEYREILYSNIEEYERMAQMIGDMLFLAKTDNGLYHLEKTDVDLGTEVRDLFEYYEAWAEERNVLLVLNGNATVKGDRLMLRRALSNLLSNAIRHTTEGGTVTLTIGQSANEMTTITIENPGEPIPPEHIPRLFDRFYRVDASRQQSGDSTGLGLAIVKSIIDLHNGDIKATSNNDCTQFRIMLSNLSE